MEMAIPTPVLPVVQYIETLERRNAELESEVRRLREVGESTAPTLDTVSLLTDPMRLINSEQVRTIIPISTVTFMCYVKDGTLDIVPNKSTERNLWRCSDILRIVRWLGGVELGFYDLSRMMAIFGYSTSSGLNAAVRSGKLPRKILLFGSEKLPVWVKEEANEEYMRRRQTP